MKNNPNTLRTDHEFHVERNPLYPGGSYSVYMIKHAGGAGVDVARAIEYERRSVNELSDAEVGYAGPWLRLAPADAQQLMDELWRAGCRPSHECQSVGQLAATEAHLADMRRLVFGKVQEEGV